MLTQLINNSGISICMVGTPESTAFFEQAMQLARRSLGLQYGKLEYDGYFHDFCKTLYQYQYVRKRSALTPAVIEWLYAHSAGVISVVVSLIHDAQEIAILDGKEELNLTTLNEAYQKRLTMLHGYMQPEEKKPMPSAKQKKLVRTKRTVGEEIIPIAALAEKAKREQLDIANLLKQHIGIEEVRV